ncbi:hypothetical protein [Nitrosomonas sp. Nm166]|uniref:hypothetical protein n=1 Tax=Nitrosomonas sp. Nm166 TaxID=1881054 RepID=UPI0008F39951|nr:hypothetical protein [Nitrosomonas sp. Nm166]SFE22549.1 hypothetical protein SAMN05428977_101011 [Nitrosomonas sp. Nm166]
MSDLFISIGELLFKLVTTGFAGFRENRKSFFETHLEPIHVQMSSIHKDYTDAFKEIESRLRNNTRPTQELLEFLKERRRDYESERTLARNLANELQKIRNRGLSDDNWSVVEEYCKTIVNYFNVGNNMDGVSGFSWFTDFLYIVERNCRNERRQDIWWTTSIGGCDPHQELLEAVQAVRTDGLPKAYESMAKQYAIVRARLL